MTDDMIYGVFDAGGILEKAFPGYEYREGQLKMALQVASAYRKKAILCVEAGTGIGKSFAYLVPALFHALENPDERTVIATSTINLQRQLYDKDIPNLFRMLGKSTTVALAVGRGNYLCLRRFLVKRDESSLFAQDPENDLYKLSQWVKKTKTGLRSDYPFRLPEDMWSDINSDSDLCLGFKCPYIGQCFYQKAKLKMKEAKIIVSNHHLLFSDAAYRYENQIGFDADGVLPAFGRLIFDEAHNIEDNATSYFTAEYDPKELKRQISAIQRKSGTSGSVIAYLSRYLPDDSVLDSKIADDIQALVNAADSLDQYLVQVFSKTNFQACLVVPELMKSGKLDMFRSLGRVVSGAADRLAKDITAFLESLERDETIEGKMNELRVRGTRIQAMGQVLSRFVDVATWTDDIYWFNPIGQKRDGTHRVAVEITPLSVAGMMTEAVFKKLDTVVCTSATLCIGGDFSFWGGRVGLPYDTVRPFATGVYPSPFDFRRRLLLLTPSDAPPYDKSDSEPYISYMADTIWNAVLSSGGGALVLFTSYRMMLDVKRKVAERFEKNRMELLCQGDEDRFTLLREFIEHRDSSLFATSSFWEGVDAPGETLRLVIIVKLPFQVPSDPVFKARCDAIDRDGGSGFSQLGLPSTAMKLKQGFGRLLRTKKDRGIVMILDSRLLTKAYGLWMIRCLPESFHPETVSIDMPEKIENFLYGS